MSDNCDRALPSTEKIKILMIEYGALRTETIHRYNNIYQLMTVAVAFAAFLAAHLQNVNLWIGFAVSGFAIVFLSWNLRLDIANAAKRVRQIEEEVNTLAGETLLVWETVWGGEIRGFWGRMEMTESSEGIPPKEGDGVKTSEKVAPSVVDSE